MAAAAAAAAGMAMAKGLSIRGRYGGIRAAKEEERGCLYFRRSLGDRESIQHAGSIVVLGNVELGSTVEAEGDIIVLGRLSGRCHAGRNGDAKSIVFALQMQPVGLSIAGCALPLNRRRRRMSPFVPEVASMQGGGVVSISSYNGQTVGALPQLELLAMRSTSSARASLFTGAYIFVAGIVFFLFPRTCFSILFRGENAVPGWIQAAGVLGMVFGVYYIGTAVGDVVYGNGAAGFYLSTVVGRIFLFCSFSWLVARGFAPVPLLLVGMINLAGALWMLYSLKK